MTDASTQRRVLVLDGDSQASRSVVTSLGSRGVDVSVGNDARGSVCGHSRYVDREFVHPDPATRPKEFVDALAGFLADTDHFAVLPTRDDTSIVVAEHKDRLEDTGTVVGVEDWPRFERALDKAVTFDVAADLSVPTPETHAPDSYDDVLAIADDLSYPVVVKPRSKHVADPDGRLYSHEVGDENYARTPIDLRRTYRNLLQTDALRHSLPLVQEYVPGRTTTTVGVADDGDLFAHFQELRLRTTPASGGNSTLITGFRDDTMLSYAREVVDALDWTGPVQVEFMRTPDDEFYLIEVNGRYWGSTPLAVASGVDVPWLHYSLLADDPIEVPDKYRDDVVQQRLLYGDLKWLGEQLGDGNVGAVRQFLAALVDADQVFVSRDDPGATVAALRQAIRLVGRTAYERVVDGLR